MYSFFTVLYKQQLWFTDMMMLTPDGRLLVKRALFVSFDFNFNLRWSITATQSMISTWLSKLLRRDNDSIYLTEERCGRKDMRRQRRVKHTARTSFRSEICMVHMPRRGLSVYSRFKTPEKGKDVRQKGNTSHSQTRALLFPISLFRAGLVSLTRSRYLRYGTTET